MNKKATLFALFLTGVVILAACGAIPGAGSTSTQSQTLEPSPTFFPFPPAPEGKLIPFETIELSEYGPITPGQRGFDDLTWVVIKSSGEVEQLRGYLTEEGYQDLKKLDYDESIAVGVFRGTLGTSGYDIEITRVYTQREKKEVFLQMFLQIPHGELVVVENLVTRPYHLIKIKKSELLDVSWFYLEVYGWIIKQMVNVHEPSKPILITTEPIPYSTATPTITPPP